MKLHQLALILAATLGFPCFTQAQDSMTVTTETPVMESTIEEEPGTLFGDLLKKYDLAPSGSITLDYYDRYVWRGQYLDRDDVLQPGISMTAKGLTVGYWSSWDMANDDALMSDESDYFVSYAYSLGPVTLSAGHTWYSFPAGSTSSRDFFVSAAVSTILSPVFTFIHDYEDGNAYGNGNYYSLGLSHTLDVYKPYGISLTLGTTVGYNDHQWLNGKGFHFTPTAALNVPVTKNMTISPNVGYNITQGDLKDPAIGNQERHIFGGVRSVVTF